MQITPNTPDENHLHDEARDEKIIDEFLAEDNQNLSADESNVY